MTSTAASRRLARSAVVIAIGAFGVLAIPASAQAHAVLETARPGAAAALQSAPRGLKLVFDEDVTPQYARVAVVGVHGRNIAGAPRVNGSVVTVPLRRAPTGSYTVRWRMVASDDGHVTEGAYSFGIGVDPSAPTPVPGQEIPAAPEVLAWLQFVAVVLTGGLLTVRALVSAPAARMVGTSPRADAPAAIGIGVAGAALGLHAGILAFLTGAYPIVGGGLLNFVDTLVEPIRAGTHLGQAWTVMTFAWFGVLALLVAAWVTPPRREPLLGAAGLLALAIAFGISWVSHPASRGALALLADYAHLLTGALWVGGLLAVVILAGFARPLPRPAGEEIARTCMVRFSNLAVPVVVLLGAAGMYLALRDLPAPSALISSRYGLTLLLKSGAAVGALGLGGYHRLRVVPRLAAGAPVATIRRTLLLETSLLVLALGFAAVLTQTAPPR